MCQIYSADNVLCGIFLNKALIKESRRKNHCNALLPKLYKTREPPAPLPYCDMFIGEVSVRLKYRVPKVDT